MSVSEICVLQMAGMSFDIVVFPWVDELRVAIDDGLDECSTQVDTTNSGCNRACREPMDQFRQEDSTMYSTVLGLASYGAASASTATGSWEVAGIMCRAM